MAVRWAVAQRVLANEPFPQFNVDVGTGTERRKGIAVGRNEFEAEDPDRLLVLAGD
jgi:hypothetical protein